jgi:hypothetical protein
MKIKRILARIRNASSSPVIAETEAGTCFVKLRGAAQGTLALVAEIIVANLAEALGLNVPKRALVTLDPDTPSDDKNDELAQLLSFSHGINLGFHYLEGARDLRPDETNLIDETTASKIVCLDALVTNPDRTPKNSNILWHQRKPWLIDHGAALGFQYDWTRVDEQTARRPYAFDRHLLIGRAKHIATAADELAGVLTRERIATAVAEVPDDFLTPHLGSTTYERRREAYTAVLWKRLNARPFSAQMPATKTGNAT